jgi:alanine-glyoxylate transaminase/serine-glyoxylate transaminase/serine-pyruvate transaminase
MTRKQLLEDFGIEIGAGLGPLAGKIWRVGLMGASSSARLVTLLLASLERTAAFGSRPRSGMVERV